MITQIPKWSSIVYRSKEAYSKLKTRLKEKRERAVIKRYISRLQKLPVEVLIGANFSKTGGVRNHILAIHQFSSLKTILFPSDEFFNQFGVNAFKVKHDAVFQEMKLPKGLKVLHSHVYPWFINWCKDKHIDGVKWIHTYHLPYFPEHACNDQMKKWQDEFNKAFIEDARHADVKLSVSKWQTNYLKEEYDIDAIYLPNGVNVALCDQGNAKKFIEKTGINNFILNVSRHDPVKNPGEFISLAQKMADYKFVVIGPGLNQEVFLNDYKVKVPDNVFIYGPAGHEEVQHAIAACSCLVSTAKKEGLPTLVLEAMAQAKPVVVSKEPGSMEAIDHGAYGYFYELGNLEDLKQKTLLAIHDSKIGKRARQRVLEEYDWRLVAKKLDAIYKGDVQQ
ncbi:MAG: glycosyltransferase involved in cell wall biosynthesis [Psychroserpens sp.]|jgi:glycosyltransferase involved in cell wall biosynthesis